MDKKILLAIPTYKYLSSLAFGNHMRLLLDGINSGLVRQLDIEVDIYVTMARNNMCKLALDHYERGAITHLLMVDDDVLLPDGSIAKLAANDVPVVSAAYYMRSFQPIAYQLDPFALLASIPNAGKIKVDGAGAGCLMIDCKVLRAMKERFGDEWWFQNKIALDGGKDKYMGEDVFFFRRLKEMGMPVMLDCDVQCGHLGIAVVDQCTVEFCKNINNSNREPTKPQSKQVEATNLQGNSGWR
jgi:hypothetical protein